MEQQRHSNACRKDFFEEFHILRKSDYWACLQIKTQQGILTLLAGSDTEKAEDKQLKADGAANPQLKPT